MALSSYAMMKTIPLTKGKVALVDDEDYALLSRHKWKANKGGYATRTGYVNHRVTTIFMHRVIMNAAPSQQVDHINHNTTDNRKVNLRLCSCKENAANKIKYHFGASVFKGVCKNMVGNWRAEIMVNKHNINLGTYKTEEDAACAYNDAALHYFGEFALLNDVPGYKQKPVFKPKNTSSSYKGVNKHKDGGWVARLAIGKGARKYLGYFKTELEAAAAIEREVVEV